MKIFGEVLVVSDGLAVDICEGRGHFFGDCWACEKGDGLLLGI